MQGNIHIFQSILKNCVPKSHHCFGLFLTLTLGRHVRSKINSRSFPAFFRCTHTPSDILRIDGTESTAPHVAYYYRYALATRAMVVYSIVLVGE